MNLLHANAKPLLDDLDGAFDFTDRLKDMFVEDGFNTDSEEGPKSYGQQVILAHHSCVWSVGVALDIVKIPAGEFWADGSGRAYGLGVAAAFYPGNAEAIVRKAVEVAIRYCDRCGGKPWLHKLEA